jgi:hypothetical protein
MFLSWWYRLASKRRVSRTLPYLAKLEELEDRLVPAATTRVFLDVGPSNSSVFAARSMTLPVFIDVDTLSGSAVGGVQSATFYVKYDPTVLSINDATVTPGTAGSDIKLGALLSSFPAATYSLAPAAGSGTGLVGVEIRHATSTFYTGTAGGHLVELDFHVLQSIPVDQTTLLDMVPDAAGHSTIIADQGGSSYMMTPPLTAYFGNLSQTGALAGSTFTPADGDQADAVIQVVAEPPNVAPAAVNDIFSMAPNTGSFPASLTVTGVPGGVLANDTDGFAPMNAVLVGGNPITVGSATIANAYTVTYSQKTAHGYVTLNALDGSFTYTPDANYLGSDSFTYQAVDAISNAPSATAAATIVVGGLVSIPQNLTIAGISGSTVNVPINIASANPSGSGGVSAVTIGINYDSRKFTVSKVEIGSVLAAAGWTNFAATVTANSDPGRIAITASGPALTSTSGGDLADIILQATAAAGLDISVLNLDPSTQLVVNGAGGPSVLPLVVAPVYNTTATPGPLDGLVVFGSSPMPPTITVSTTALDLSSTLGGTPGAFKTYAVSGGDLDGPIDITAPTGVEISADGGFSYHTTLTLAPTLGIVPARPSMSASALVRGWPALPEGSRTQVWGSASKTSASLLLRPHSLGSSGSVLPRWTWGLPQPARQACPALRRHSQFSAPA